MVFDERSWVSARELTSTCFVGALTRRSLDDFADALLTESVTAIWQNHRLFVLLVELFLTRFTS